MSGSPFHKKRERGDSEETAGLSIQVSWNREGIEFHSEPHFDGWLAVPARFRSDSELVLLLGQLEDEGFAEQNTNGMVLRWPEFYKIAGSADYREGVELMRLPPVESWRPSLVSRGTLTDTDFSVVIEKWLDPEGRTPMGNVDINGAVITSAARSSILPESVWRVLEAVASLRSRPASMRGVDANRRAWADIRSHAALVADMADFLRKTVVLTPERLSIGMRKTEVAGAKIVEVLPGFTGEPKRWLEFFDRMPNVPERYEIPDGNGIVHVLLSPEVRTVLREVRRMPGRRVAGERAEAFVRNPFAALGPDASKVIDAGEFEKEREVAGISFARFTALARRDDKGFPYECALLIEETFRGEIRSEQVPFQGPSDLERFLVKLEDRMASDAQCCHWEGFDLEILGDTPDQARLLREALSDMREPRGFKVSEILDLSQYSDRVEGFGVEKPYYSPFIARKSKDGGWFPDNVAFGLCYTPEVGGETVAFLLDEQSIRLFREEVRKAKVENRETLIFPGCPEPVRVDWAAETLETLGKAREDVGRGQFDPKRPSSANRISERKGLVVKSNVNALDYEELRGALAPSGEPPRLPSSLLPTVSLKDHQLVGVAWLQHLWRMSPSTCRGALLADDMGLGKTIQILTFIASIIEYEPKIDPFLIVAPVSLLENWKEEISKFFAPGTMEVLTLYGPALAEKRMPKQELDQELVRAGVTRLLAPGWLGSAQVVLTTYETLRDLEFSLARQRWSGMICDEAQKIKNPNALVTRAAKKQNARLRIACTGTPVENTLTDIWCLFDFAQPGLLGALKDFGHRYRKPIEAETEEEKARLEELRTLIEPQKLRRMKSEVAKDLPRKIEVESCRALPISDQQRRHYANVIAAFRGREQGSQGSGLQSPLGLLQYLRRLCSDPRPPGIASTNSESVADIERNSPKMSWLMGLLRVIQAQGEKVVIFCEFRDLQRTLQRVVRERFGFLPDVINGDTTADLGNANNRQRRLRAFQQKPGFGVIVLSPLAVGFGVNIQAANHVVHFTRTWNPAKEDQATDRVYRIGQEKDVHVYYPVVVAHDFVTFDAKLDQLLEWKRGLSTDMLNGTGDVSAADFGDLEAPDGGNAFGEEIVG